MECLLLTGHVTDPGCPCHSDTENCSRKHLLTIEALAKETYPMLDDLGEKQHMLDLADDARAWRKQLEQLAGDDNPGEDPDLQHAGNRQPLRVEQLPGAEVRIYKEQDTFYAGSFRTIKPKENTLVLLGCPKNRAIWRDDECVCLDGERGCMELHSIKVKE